jgi:hypothetical protein
VQLQLLEKAFLQAEKSFVEKNRESTKISLFMMKKKMIKIPEILDGFLVTNSYELLTADDKAKMDANLDRLLGYSSNANEETSIATSNSSSKQSQEPQPQPDLPTPPTQPVIVATAPAAATAPVAVLLPLTAENLFQQKKKVSSSSAAASSPKRNHLINWESLATTSVDSATLNNSFDSETTKESTATIQLSRKKSLSQIAGDDHSNNSSQENLSSALSSLSMASCVDDDEEEVKKGKKKLSSPATASLASVPATPSVCSANLPLFTALSPDYILPKGSLQVMKRQFILRPFSEPVSYGKFRMKYPIVIKRLPFPSSSIPKDTVDSREKHIKLDEFEASLKELEILKKLGSYPTILYCYGYLKQFSHNKKTSDSITAASSSTVASSRQELQFIYEFPTYGNLENLLFDFALFPLNSPTSKLPMPLLLAWCCDLLDALQFLHYRGMAFNNLQLGNILLFENMKLKLSNFTKVKSVLILEEIPYLNEESQALIPELNNDFSDLVNCLLQIFLPCTEMELLTQYLVKYSKEKLFASVILPEQLNNAVPSSQQLQQQQDYSRLSSSSKKLFKHLSLTSASSSSNSLPKQLEANNNSNCFESKFYDLLVSLVQRKDLKLTARQLFNSFYQLMEETFEGDPRDKISTYRKPIRKLEKLIKAQWKGFEEVEGSFCSEDESEEMFQTMEEQKKDCLLRSFPQPAPNKEELVIDYRRNLVYWLIKDLSPLLSVAQAEDMATTFIYHGLTSKEMICYYFSISASSTNSNFFSFLNNKMRIDKKLGDRLLISLLN